MPGPNLCQLKADEKDYSLINNLICCNFINIVNLEMRSVTFKRNYYFHLSPTILIFESQYLQ